MEDNCRLKLSNLPSFASFQHVKKFVKSRLGEIPFRKMKHTGTMAFFSVHSDSNAEKAVMLLDNVMFKKNQLSAKRIENEPTVNKAARNIPRDHQNIAIEKTATELVTPLAKLPYTEQLEIKLKASKSLLISLRRQMFQANVQRAPKEEHLQKVLPSPITEGYRNKCEFTIGYSGEEQQENTPGNIVVGFISGKMANKQLRIVPANDCPNLGQNTLAIVHHFQHFVRQFTHEPFDEFKRIGFWKMLTVKDFLGDCMIIVTVHPHSDPEVPAKVKQAFVDAFLPSKITSEITFRFNVTSIYWQEQANASDERVYEHLAGAPYIYESLLGVSFCISPSTFFQTNSRAAAILYRQIGDLLGLSYFEKLSKNADKLAINMEENNELVSHLDQNSNDGELVEKKPRLDEEQKEKPAEEVVDRSTPNSTVFLDICCGAGSIGLCLMHRLRKAAEFSIGADINKFGCIGVELNAEAVKDARRNAAENGFDARSCVYIDGRAEKIFEDLKFHMPNNCSLTSSKLLGIIDPPRAGVSDKVIIGCRRLVQLKTLAYISCDPKSAMKNLVDLCRPFSRKFEGEPFQIVSIQPVDMFPLTEHFEWIVKMQR